MSVNNNSKRKNRCTLQSILLFAAGVMLIFAASGTGMPLAAAVTEKTLDPGIGCGKQYWGLKSGPYENNLYKIGKKPDCVGIQDPAYFGRQNYVKVHTFLPGDSSQQYATQWQAIIQGTDPWGNNGYSSGNGFAPLTMNANFPAPANLNYNLKVQWLWTNTAKPLTDNVYAQYLTNLWLVNSNSVIVIDFMWMKLQSTGTGPYNWQQLIVSDESTASGIQYYDPYCDRESPMGVAKNVFHYNVVLDNTSHGSGQWIEKISAIASRITQATTYTGYVQGGPFGNCTTLTPGAVSSYQIVDIETGIEVAANGAGKSGKAEGGFSNTNLYY